MHYRPQIQTNSSVVESAPSCSAIFNWGCLWQLTKFATFNTKGKYEVLVQGDANTPKYDAKI